MTRVFSCEPRAREHFKRERERVIYVYVHIGNCEHRRYLGRAELACMLYVCVYVCVYV